MREISIPTNSICCYKMQHSSTWGKTYKSVCGKPATHTNGHHFFCRHHSKTGRFVLRIGDVGEILARFDTEKEMRDAHVMYPNSRMQMLTKSKRRDIY